MTIQLSVLLWTVICFCVLMLVLDRLLFRPLLQFMDARQAKIDGAREKRETAEKARQEALAAAEQARLAEEKRQRDGAAAALEQARHAAAQSAAQAELDCAARLEQQKAALEAERQQICAKLDAGMEDLVSAFAAKLAP